jgi:hypothetical protein
LSSQAHFLILNLMKDSPRLPESLVAVTAALALGAAPVGLNHDIDHARADLATLVGNDSETEEVPEVPPSSGEGPESARSVAIQYVETIPPEDRAIANISQLGTLLELIWQASFIQPTSMFGPDRSISIHNLPYNLGLTVGSPYSVVDGRTQERSWRTMELCIPDIVSELKKLSTDLEYLRDQMVLSGGGFCFVDYYTTDDPGFPESVRDAFANIMFDEGEPSLCNVYAQLADAIEFEIKDSLSNEEKRAHLEIIFSRVRRRVRPDMSHPNSPYALYLELTEDLAKILPTDAMIAVEKLIREQVRFTGYDEEVDSYFIWEDFKNKIIRQFYREFANVLPKKIMRKVIEILRPAWELLKPTGLLTDEEQAKLGPIKEARIAKKDAAVASEARYNSTRFRQDAFMSFLEGIYPELMQLPAMQLYVEVLGYENRWKGQNPDAAEAAELIERYQAFIEQVDPQYVLGGNDLQKYMDPAVIEESAPRHSRLGEARFANEMKGGLRSYLEGTLEFRRNLLAQTGGQGWDVKTPCQRAEEEKLRWRDVDMRRRKWQSVA